MENKKVTWRVYSVDDENNWVLEYIIHNCTVDDIRDEIASSESSFSEDVELFAVLAP